MKTCLYISLFLLFIGCSKEKKKDVFNIFGNINRTCSFEKQKNIWNGIVYTEKVNISDSSGFATFPLSLGGNTFITSTNNGFITCFENTELIWKTPLDSGEYVISNFVADWQKNIFFITSTFRIISISTTGKVNWALQLRDSIQWVSTLLSTDDAILFSTSSKKLYKYSFDGKLLWERNLPIPTTQTFAGFRDGIVANLTYDEFEKTDTVFFLIRMEL